jgi:chemotaxis protein methyltransferase CheR
MIKISPEEFIAFSAYIHSLCGISLDISKSYLIETRLAPILKDLGVLSFSELYYKAKQDITHSIPNQIVEAITTNETSFFRDTAPFDLLKQKVLPEILDAMQRDGGGNKNLRIWSAAASTGQEVYSTAIVVAELLAYIKGYTCSILGTDINNHVIGTASRGIYHKNDLDRGINASVLHKWFVPEKDSWKVRDELRAMVSFRKLNLLEDFSTLGKFDIIFCRNVAIYFNETNRKSLFDRLGKALSKNGVLIVGATESLLGMCPQFESFRHMRSVYYKLKV